MHWTRCGLLVLLLVVLSGQVHAVAPEQAILEARLLGLEAASRLVIAYNPNITRQRDNASARDESQVFYERFRAQVLGLQGDSLAADLKKLELLLDQVPTVAQRNEGMLPGVLNPLLQLHVDLDGQLASLGAAQAVEEQMIDLARISLLYQARLFNGLMVFADAHERDVLGMMDERILQRFEVLGSDPSLLSTRVAQSERSYRFVRSRMLDPATGWIPDAAAFYLDAAVKQLSMSKSKALTISAG